MLGFFPSGPLARIRAEQLHVRVADVDDCVVLGIDHWNLDLVWRQEVGFISTTGDDVSAVNVALGMPMLWRLALYNINDTAWATFEDCVASLPQLVDWYGCWLERASVNHVDVEIVLVLLLYIHETYLWSGKDEARRSINLANLLHFERVVQNFELKVENFHWKNDNSFSIWILAIDITSRPECMPHNQSICEVV